MVARRLGGLQVTSWPDSCEVALRASRALRSLVAARYSVNKNAAREAQQALCKALRPTEFCQSFDSSTVSRLVAGADLLDANADQTKILQGDEDGLYVVLTGEVRILSVSGGRSLKITIESARDLLGDSEKDRLDPYVIFKVGSKRFQTEIEMDSGANPTFNFSVTLHHEGEEEIEFFVMEYDEYSKDDSIAYGFIHIRHFADGFKGEIELQPPKNRKNKSNLEEAGFLKVNIDWVAAAAQEAPKLVQVTSTELSRSPDGAATDQELEQSQGVDGSASAPTSPVAQRKTRRESAMEQGTPKNFAGKVLTSGGYFGEESGGQLLCVTDCVLMFVSRTFFSASLKEVGDERGKERDSFLRKWLQGASTVEDRVFEAFSATFQLAAFPRGHVFCSEGQQTAGRRVYLIKKGECRVNLSAEATLQGCTRPTGQGSSMGVRRTVESSGHNGQPNEVGIVGEGQLLGYASALFGIPEPFTATATNEVVEAYWINVSQRPTSTWPREIVKPLLAVLRMRVSYHEKRKQCLVDNEPKLDISDSDARDCDHLLQSVRSSTSAIGPRRRNIDKGLAASPFLKNKDTTSWKLQAITERFTGWVPGDAKRTAQPVKSTSLPNLQSKEDADMRPHTSSSFPSRCPSRQVNRRQPNLYCHRDWASMSAVASANAMSKMYKQQARLGSSSGFKELSQSWG
eukprot:gnl/MRDRNA2_/MRDRNA2_73138_c0_seq1.p1 gnl/MRDRNA2_/MRDRNA2_73138_c0~~gnl/MRDRNA2_/MRDRNA2_73138_c0_seq1.p1  ORF type:complete len:685 (-),score=94.80 gnl/MRDRNA2_/MRDRNA2_73138_c0_seq1:98-2152(-)